MQTEKYLLAILPPQPILDDIQKIKEHFRETYHSKGALNAPAHITMHMPFEWRHDREDLLIEKLQAFCATQNRLAISLNGFDSFPPRVIFVNVVTNPELVQTQRQLFSFCKNQLSIFNATYKDQPFHPHITVAFRDLKKNDFAVAWEEFKGRSYHADFECAAIDLLKHDGKFWQPFRSFVFIPEASDK